MAGIESEAAEVVKKINSHDELHESEKIIFFFSPPTSP